RPHRACTRPTRRSSDLTDRDHRETRRTDEGCPGMIINFVLLAAVAVLMAAGVYLFLDRALTKMLMGLLLMGNGINLFILMGGGKDRKSTRLNSSHVSIS